ELDGLSPEQAARRIWTVTYSPDYLARHRDIAEAQMRREIELPTPLHAADLQFQALAEFDASKAVGEIRCSALILTGDLDELVPPQNAMQLARLIPAAKLVIIAGSGHRVFWEATQRCADVVIAFLNSVSGSVSDAMPHLGRRVPATSDALT